MPVARFSVWATLSHFHGPLTRRLFSVGYLCRRNFHIVCRPIMVQHGMICTAKEGGCYDVIVLAQNTSAASSRATSPSALYLAKDIDSLIKSIQEQGEARGQGIERTVLERLKLLDRQQLDGGLQETINQQLTLIDQPSRKLAALEA